MTKQYHRSGNLDKYAIGVYYNSMNSSKPQYLHVSSHHCFQMMNTGYYKPNWWKIRRRVH